MKQYDLSALLGNISSSLISYLASSLPVGNHRSQERLGERFFELWNQSTFKGPYIESVPEYRSDKSLDQLLSGAPPNDAARAVRDRLRARSRWQEIDTRFPQFFSARERLWQPATDEEIAEKESTCLHRLCERPLYLHQIESFLKIASHHQHIVVATGTGSGKTECFLIPLLIHLLREPENARVQTGVRALLLYPMNALVEDQIGRLRRLLFWVNLLALDSRLGDLRLARPISFGRYTGETPVSDHDNAPDRYASPEALHELGELRYREEMQNHPPDILVTNFTMLEYMLLRNDDRRLFQSPASLRFLVLDEVHTYHGTTGMEVATLLRRFRDFLRRGLGGAQPNYVCIGTSATLGSGEHVRQGLAQFATQLFGVPFGENQVVLGRPQPRPSENPATFNSDRLLNELPSLRHHAPNLCREFALERDMPGPEDDITRAEWENLALILESAPPAEQFWAGNPERVEILGHILLGSPVFVTLRRLMLTAEHSVLPLDELARRLFGTDMFANRAEECRRALSRIIQLAAAARSNDQGLLPLRVHLFVKEHRQAFLCLNPQHTPQPDARTDGWWSKLFVAHRQHCDECESLVYPLFLCRKCGFVVLEGWRRKSWILPERDDLLGAGQFRRVLFRPLNSVPEALLQQLRADCDEITLCTHCGNLFVHNQNLQGVLAHHEEICPRHSFIEAVEWQNGEADAKIYECPYCDQDWFKDQEVITPPSLSVYSAATVLLEELKRGVDSPLEGTGRVNKVLGFSDSRQQAAVIASRLQHTNEDFTFRQLLFQVLKGFDQPVTPRQLLPAITERVANTPLAHLLCEATEADDEHLVRKRITTLLFIETCTEYRTLEALGIYALLYADRIFEPASTLLASHHIGRRLNPAERRSLVEVFLNWGFRFRRWAVFSPVGLQPNFAELQRYGYQDRCVRKLGGPFGTVGFSLQKSDYRNRLLNFYSRLCRRLAVPVAGDLSDFKNLVELFWDQVLSRPELQTSPGLRHETDPAKPLVALGGSDPGTLALKLNWASVRWQLTYGRPLFRCDACGYLTTASVRGICPVRNCAGTLQFTSQEEISQQTFSPLRHYAALIQHKDPKPLNVEEHTAQISARARRRIEESFRKDEVGSVDVISGSTTFELGIDLGQVNAVFLANMPPEVSNYRQRAGRAGRRTGMLPIVVTYVRERPHDSYFWNQPEHFIAGPLRLPRFSVPSHEVVLRHVNAVFFAWLLQRQGGKSRLEGPPIADFISFTESQHGPLQRDVGTPGNELASSVRAILAANPNLTLTPLECLDKFLERLQLFKDTYLALHTSEGAISVLSDYGILPSYNYPIYVDELRLFECPRTSPPRCDLKLQRDRRIAITEYYPGRVIIAGKAPIRSVGLWAGFQRRLFFFCPECKEIDTGAVAANQAAQQCRNGCGPLVRRQAVLPLGGFLGKHEEGLVRQDPDLFLVARSDYIFDPAGNPPPVLQSFGRAVRAARQTSFHIQQTGARMRIFTPRPDADQSPLELIRTWRQDVALPGIQKSECLIIPSEASGQAERVCLMHEFTTDILRLQVGESEVGRQLLFAPKLLQAISGPEDSEKRKAETIFLWTFAQALCTGAARLLEIDPAEIAFTFRFARGALLNREIILFDTAAGGAGYCDQIYEDLRGLFSSAVEVLECKANCGDSCYSCLRSYDNQAIHARLNRFYVLDGLRLFDSTNWSARSATT